MGITKILIGCTQEKDNNIYKMKREIKHLIIIGHPDQKSFCYNGIYKTIIRQMNKYKSDYRVIDLYEDKLHRDKVELIKSYKDLVTWSTHIYFVSPVWWFRLTPKLEMFFDEVFTPGFAYKFVPIIGKYAYPKPFFKNKKVRTYITHGAPKLPVITLYLNSVKLRLVMGVYTFVFGWNLNRWTKTKQFWSVPFVSKEKRRKYLRVVKEDIRKDLGL